MFGQLILRHSDNFSRTLQHAHISAAEGQRAAAMTVRTLETIRDSANFDMLTYIEILADKVSSLRLPTQITKSIMPLQFLSCSAIEEAFWAKTSVVNYFCYVKLLTNPPHPT